MEIDNIIKYLKEKYPWKFNKELNKLIIIDFEDNNIKFYIGKILFKDDKTAGIRLLGTITNMYINIKTGKKDRDIKDNIISIFPNIYDEFDINKSCEIIILDIINNIKNINSDINTKDMYEFIYLI